MRLAEIFKSGNVFKNMLYCICYKDVKDPAIGRADQLFRLSLLFWMVLAASHALACLGSSYFFLDKKEAGNRCARPTMSKGCIAAIGLGALAAPAFLAPSSTASQLRGVEVSSPAPRTSQSSQITTGVIGAASVAAVASFVIGKRPSNQPTPVACHAFDPSTEVGATAPLGFFDPAGFTKDIDEKGFKKLRAAEIKHARGAMMGALGLLVQSVYKFPGYESVPSGLAAQWTEPGSNSLWLLFGAIGCLELGLSPWKEDPDTPGDLGDPLNLAKGNVTDDMRSLDAFSLLYFELRKSDRDCIHKELVCKRCQNFIPRLLLKFYPASLELRMP